MQLRMGSSIPWRAATLLLLLPALMLKSLLLAPLMGDVLCNVQLLMPYGRNAGHTVRLRSHTPSTTSMCRRRPQQHMCCRVLAHSTRVERHHNFRHRLQCADQPGPASAQSCLKLMHPSLLGCRMIVHPSWSHQNTVHA